MNVQDFWDKQAVEHGTSCLATDPDPNLRQLEIKSIIPHIQGESVLDVGCGNGYSTIIFRQAHPASFVGVDFSTEMIAAANSQTDKGDISFLHADVRTLSSLEMKFDTIISERCLINLTTWQEQKDALSEMAACLNPGGRLVLVENFIDGQNNLNGLRKSFGLPEIPVRWHNRYMIIKEFETFISQKASIQEKSNIACLYYMISRVVYAELCRRNNTEPDYHNDINEIASCLPSLGSYKYSPTWLYVLTP